MCAKLNACAWETAQQIGGISSPFVLTSADSCLGNMEVCRTKNDGAPSMYAVCKDVRWNAKILGSHLTYKSILQYIHESRTGPLFQVHW